MLAAEPCAAACAGGRLLVTVWAFEQEDPRKLAKWQRMAAPPAPAPGSAAADEGRGGGDLDYMVPWHLPFHRMGAAQAAAHAAGGPPPPSPS